jgi:hypothetical protein
MLMHGQLVCKVCRGTHCFCMLLPIVLQQRGLLTRCMTCVCSLSAVERQCRSLDVGLLFQQ